MFWREQPRNLYLSCMVYLLKRYLNPAKQTAGNWTWIGLNNYSLIYDGFATLGDSPNKTKMNASVQNTDITLSAGWWTSQPNRFLCEQQKKTWHPRLSDKYMYQLPYHIFFPLVIAQQKAENNKMQLQSENSKHTKIWATYIYCTCMMNYLFDKKR